MSIELNWESPGKFDSRTLSRETLSTWTGRTKGAVPQSATVAEHMFLLSKGARAP